MADSSQYQMAIDLLRCHLGLSEDEAKEQLGLSEDHPAEDDAASYFNVLQQER
jgi:hypothetical protein